jgi:hypothetical protein
MLALRRWFASLTLSSPDFAPGSTGFWCWLAGLVALLVVSVALQGPGRALVQVLDPAGHARLLALALGRLRKAGRVVATTIGLTVLSWTADQSVGFFSQTRGQEDLLRLTRSRTPMQLAWEHGSLAALTPLRDLCGLADNTPMLLLAAMLIFHATSGRWTAATDSTSKVRRMGAGWASVCWGGMAIYAFYRIGSKLMGARDLPMGGCLGVEALVVPSFMLLCDGALLAWVLSELRDSGLRGRAGEPLDPIGALGLMPAASLACLAALPSRYLATFAVLAYPRVSALLPGGRVADLMWWQLGPGLAAMQGAALVVAGLAGSVAWNGGDPWASLSGYVRLLRTSGGRLLGVLLWGGLAAGMASAAIYSLVLALPPQGWVLASADGYAHYATLPVGLLVLSAMVELGRSSVREEAADADDEKASKVEEAEFA